MLRFRFGECDQPLHVLHRKEKSGLGRAYIAGFKWALARDYEFVFEIDCDFYVAGPMDFVATICMELRSAGVPAAQVFAQEVA